MPFEKHICTSCGVLSTCTSHLPRHREPDPLLCYNFLGVSGGCFCWGLSSVWTRAECSSPQGQWLWAFQPGYGLSAQISSSFLPLPSCLPLGLQERCGDHSRHGHCPWVSLTCCGISKSWARQETHSWRCCFPAWSREDPLRDNLGLLGHRCGLVPSVVGRVLRRQHVGAGGMWLCTPEGMVTLGPCQATIPLPAWNSS